MKIFLSPFPFIVAPGKLALSRFFKYLLRIVSVCILLLVLLFGALVAWVITGPRSLAPLTPYIESALAPDDGSFHVKIGSSILSWDGWSHPVGIRVINVDVVNAGGASLAHFGEVGIHMYFFELLRGKLDVKSIELLHPVLRFVQDDKGKITSFGFSNDSRSSEGQLPAALTLLTNDGGDNPITRLKSLTIRNANLSVDDSHGQPFLVSPNASIEITRQRGTAVGRLRMPLQFDGKRSEMDIRFTIDGNKKSVTSSVVFSDVGSGVLFAVAPSQKWMQGIHVGLSGWANMVSDFDGNIGHLDFMIETSAGTVEMPEQLERKLALKRIKVAGSLGDHLATLNVKEGVVDFPDHSLTFRGTAHRVDDDYGIDAGVEATSLATDDIHAYWPLKLAPHSRKWVITHVSKGRVAKASVALHFKPGEFKLKNTPDAAVDSTIVLKGATIVYKPSHPPITDIDGTVRFTGQTMDAKITSAKYLNETHITAARVRFPDFYPDDVKLFIDLALDTTAKDVQRFLSLPDLDKARKLGLTQEATGQASGEAKLDFIAFSENDKDDVGATGKMNYSVGVDLKGVSQKGFLGNRDITDAVMHLNVDNKGLKLEGKARVNAIPMNIDLSTSFAKKSETTYTIRANIPVARLTDFGLPKLDFAAGTLGVDASFFTSDDQDKADAVVDLTQASIALAKQGLVKKIGEKAMLSLSTQQLPSGNTLIKPFNLKGDDYSVGGSAEYSKDINDFDYFTLSPLKLGETDLDSLNYQQQGNTISVKARGASFDATRYLADTSGKNSNLGYSIDLQTPRLILGEGREMNTVNLQADCPAEACRSARISARLKDGTPFSYIIANGRLASTCDNAGELVRTLGIFDTIEGGKMALNGEYKAGNLEGLLEIKNYTIKRAPIMTKVFTIASLSGIVDTLAGNGIYFDRLSAPYVFHRGIVLLKEARTHGAALGITADGVIDTNKSTFDITGVLVPSYTLNSLVGHVPLIGDLITGGAGKGLVALSYGVHGEMKDPSVRVNPLSVLTPGFLRNVFTIFDKPPPDMGAIQAQQKVAAPASDAAPAAGSVLPQTLPIITPVAPAALAAPTLPSTDELKQ